MKVMLLLNGNQGIQTGIEDGFLELKNEGAIKSLNWFYFEDFARNNGYSETLDKILSNSIENQPDLIIFFHIGSFPITKELLIQLKNITSKPFIVYDEGDMYGSWAKPITKSMKIIMTHSDLISIRGLGKFYESVRSLNKHIIYTPHHNDIARFDDYSNNVIRKKQIVLIGNRVKSRAFNFVRRLPGALQREKFARLMGNEFNEKFKLFGNGWNDFTGNQGPVAFQKQNEVYRASLITVAYEHYPNIPYYYSNRLPSALSNGSLYVCHYREGYDNIFKNCDFIFFFKSNQEAIDIINFIFSLPEDELLKRSENARAFGKKYFLPKNHWGSFLNRISLHSNYISGNDF